MSERIGSLQSENGASNAWALEEIALVQSLVERSLQEIEKCHDEDWTEGAKLLTDSLTFARDTVASLRPALA